MITERRQIIFSNEALKDAVALLREAHPERVPMGAIRRVWTVADPETQLVVQIEQAGARTLHEHALNEREAAAAVILLCRKVRIPLPRSSDKFLETESGGLSLVITKRIPIGPQQGGA
ncbi:hypothetical protein [Arenibaculum pallidiluteum]|uniref:hypothetical protein n=1 Tax=Arenibaculum pallidiluteum TaxID=2812559 RepID=UPI001A9698AE|nr:hypothetical protein [Arenibaculum pallidiluteum]